MRLTESMIRRIIRQETKRALNEGDGMYTSESDRDPSAYVREKMDEIKQMFMGGYDPEEAKDDASAAINDLCDDLRDILHDWLDSYLKDEEQDRAEYDDDMEHDR